MSKFTAYVIVGTLIVGALLAAVLLRWQVVAVASNNLPVAYLLDRWNGEVFIVGGGNAILQPRVRQ